MKMVVTTIDVQSPSQIITTNKPTLSFWQAGCSCPTNSVRTLKGKDKDMFICGQDRCVFCLLVVLAKLSLLAKWLARKTPLRKPNRGEGIISIKPRLKSAHDFLGLLYCFIVLLCIYVVSCPTWYIILLLWRDGLFVLKVPLNPKQTNKQYGRTRVKRDVMTLTFDLLGHCACVWCGSSYTPSLYQHWISYIGLVLLKTWN